MTDDRRPTTEDGSNSRRETRDKRQKQIDLPSSASCLLSRVSSAVVGGRWSVVVIGCGNDLRGDDALGPLAATAVAAWDMPGVQALAIHQLMPELAEALAEADLAIFVDARVPTPSFLCQGSGPGCEEEEIVSVQPIEAAASDSALGHTGDPGALLALTKALYGRCPAAVSITVPARSFAFGAGLSPAAERGLVAALQQIRILIAKVTYATSTATVSQRTLREQRIPLRDCSGEKATDRG
jgi:hydrogenase maturation protease